MSKNILLNSLILSIGILIGRLSGYIRELIIASKFEVSSTADTIILMLTVPDLLNNLLAGGVISGILIPILAKYKNEKIEEIVADFTKKLFVIFLMLYIFVITIIFFVYDFYFFSLLSLSLLAVFPNILTFVISSYLQYERRFKAQSLNTLLFNITIITFLLLGFENYLFAIGVVVASIIRMLWIAYDLRATPINLTSLFIQRKEEFIGYKLLIFMIFANGLIFINPMIDKLFASFLQEGSVAMLSYSEKIYLLPVSVFLTTYAIAMFPDLAKMVTKGDKKSIHTLLKKSILFNISISFIIAILFYKFSYEIVNLFYSIAHINESSLKEIATLLNAYLPSLLFAGTNTILLNVFFAYKCYKKLIYYSIFMFLSKVIIDIFIVYFQYDVFYIALSTSISVLLSVFILFFIFIIYKNKESFHANNDFR